VKYGAAVEKGLALLIPAMEGMVEGKIKCRWHALQLLDRARKGKKGQHSFPF
jgi:hypothetical protein